MVDYTGISLIEASSLISNKLIDIKIELENKKIKLEEDKKRFEADYIAANDGDASENAPLDAARDNLKFVTGQIAKNLILLRQMEGLEDAEYLIGSFNYQSILDSLRNLDEDVQSFVISNLNITDINDDEHIISVLKDSKKVIEFIIDTLYKVLEKYPTVERSVFLSALKELYNALIVPKYNNCGKIVTYSTIKLECNNEDKGISEMVIKIYPKGVSFVDIGVIAADSRIGSLLLGRKVGDTVSLIHNSNKKLLMYTVKEIY